MKDEYLKYAYRFLVNNLKIIIKDIINSLFNYGDFIVFELSSGFTYNIHLSYVQPVIIQILLFCLITILIQYIIYTHLH